MKRTATILIAFIFIALVGAAYACVSGSGRGGGASVQAATALGKRLRVSGHMRGLYPGVEAGLRVRVKNNLPFGVRLVSIRTFVADARGCAATNVSVARYRGPLPIPAHRSRRAMLEIKMSSQAPPSCQRARFPLRFAAAARR